MRLQSAQIRASHCFQNVILRDEVMSNPSSYAVYCQGVTKSFGSNHLHSNVLKGVDLCVKPHETLILAGPSGSGKTTLISIIAGILRQDGGDCFIYGNNLMAMNDEEQAKYRNKNIGFLFQSYNLIPTLTVAENVAVPLLIHGISFEDALAEAEIIVHDIGLSDYLNELPRVLSGGQQQRIAIGRALISKPKLIVCDEPTSALDNATGEKILQLLKSHAAKNHCALIIVTHDNRIFKFGDRVVVMHDGRVLEEIKNPD